MRSIAPFANIFWLIYQISYTRDYMDTIVLSTPCSYISVDISTELIFKHTIPSFMSIFYDSVFISILSASTYLFASLLCSITFSISYAAIQLLSNWLDFFCFISNKFCINNFLINSIYFGTFYVREKIWWECLRWCCCCCCYRWRCSFCR